MKLIVGLGNPGSEHRLNRHNLGFHMLGFWVAQQKERFTNKPQFQGELVKFRFGEEDVVALLPLTYMNRSGEAIGRVMSFYKIPITDVVVIHDEVDIPSGALRVKQGGGHGGNNGLRSIEPLGTDYVRLRLGVGRPPHPEMDVADYVLGNLTAAEQARWEEKWPAIADAIALCLQGRVQDAMNKYNRKD